MSTLNRARGETGLSINGEVQCLCLTLGALAYIETALGTSSLDDLAQRLRLLSAADVLAVLSALLMGAVIRNQLKVCARRKLIRLKRQQPLPRHFPLPCRTFEHVAVGAIAPRCTARVWSFASRLLGLVCSGMAKPSNPTR